MHVTLRGLSLGQKSYLTQTHMTLRSQCCQTDLHPPSIRSIKYISQGQAKPLDMEQLQNTLRILGLWVRHGQNLLMLGNTQMRVCRNYCFTDSFNGSARAHPRTKFTCCVLHNSLISAHIQFSLIKSAPIGRIKLNAYFN